MDILITCIVYLLLVGSLAYFIVAENGKKNRKQLNVLEVHFSNGTAFVAWGICFCFNTLFTLDNYLMFLSSVNREIPYWATSIIFSCLLLIGYYLERWKVVIDKERIIKYGLFVKRTFNICDITEIKQKWFGHKYYIGNRKIFSTNARYHDYSRAFKNCIEEKTNCRIISNNN